MKRLILGILLCLLLSAGVSAAGVEALYINCTVQTDGAADYSLAVSCRFETAEKEFTIPLAGDKITNVTVSGAKWDLKTDDGWTRAVLRSSDGFVGRQTFVVNYRVSAPKNQPGNDDIVLWLTGSRWALDAKEVTFFVEMPAALENQPVITSGYSGELTGVAELTGAGFTGGIPGGLMAHESLTASLTLPEGYFTHRQLRSLLSLDWVLLLLLLLTALCVAYWVWQLRNHRMTVYSRVLPPEGWTPAETPVILTGGRADIAALLPLWGQLGYVYVSFAGGELVLSRGMAMGSERPAHEAKLFRTMFDGRREFWMPDRRFQQATAQAARTARRIWWPRLFDSRGGNPDLLRWGSALVAGLATVVSVTALLPTGAGWSLLGLLTLAPGAVCGLMGQQAVGALRRCPWLHPEPLPGLAALIVLAAVCLMQPLYGVPALALQVFTGWQLAYGGRRTAAGIEALAQLLGLRRFLLRASPRRMRELLARDPAYVQTILPYAEQLGLTGRLMQLLEKTRIEEPAWLQTDEPLRTAPALAAQERELLAQLRQRTEDRQSKWMRNRRA